MKGWLGVDYTDRLRSCFNGRLPGFSDLVCFWLEKAREATLRGKCRRVGLVATSSVRGGTNRVVLDAIAEKLVIYDAWGELPWTIEGARVEVSIICFAAEANAPEVRWLDGRSVANINADLTAGLDLTKAKSLPENRGASLLGIQKSGPFDIPGEIARQWLMLPVNPNRRSNRDVLKPYWNVDDVTGRPPHGSFIGFPPSLPHGEAALFEKLFS